MKQILTSAFVAFLILSSCKKEESQIREYTGIINNGAVTGIPEDFGDSDEAKKWADSLIRAIFSEADVRDDMAIAVHIIGDSIFFVASLSPDEATRIKKDSRIRELSVGGQYTTG